MCTADIVNLVITNIRPATYSQLALHTLYHQYSIPSCYWRPQSIIFINIAFGEITGWAPPSLEVTVPSSPSTRARGSYHATIEV